MPRPWDETTGLADRAARDRDGGATPTNGRPSRSVAALGLCHGVEPGAAAPRGRSALRGPRRTWSAWLAGVIPSTGGSRSRLVGKA